MQLAPSRLLVFSISPVLPTLMQCGDDTPGTWHQPCWEDNVEHVALAPLHQSGRARLWCSNRQLPKISGLKLKWFIFAHVNIPFKGWPGLCAVSPRTQQIMHLASWTKPGYFYSHACCLHPRVSKSVDWGGVPTLHFKVKVMLRVGAHLGVRCCAGAQELLAVRFP